MSFIGCNSNDKNASGESAKTNIPNINIQTIDNIDVEIVSAAPSYITPKNSKEQTLLTIEYSIRNNSGHAISNTEYTLACTGYASDGKVIFDEETNLLFIKPSELVSGKYTEGQLNTGFINGVEKIVELDVILKRF